MTAAGRHGRGSAGILAGLAAGGLAAAAAAWAGGSAPWLAVYAYGVVFLYECLVYLQSWRDTRVDVAVQPARVAVGGSMTLNVRADRGRLAWLSWARARIETPAGEVTVSLDKRAAHVQVEVQARTRGVFDVGRVRLEAGDVFGFFQYTRELAGTVPVVVHPPVVPVRGWTLPIAGGDAGPRRNRSGAARPAADGDWMGVRAYAAGDSMSRVHWPSTARRQQLMVREWEPAAAAPVWLVPDWSREAYAGRLELFDLMLAVTASLIAHLQEDGVPCRWVLPAGERARVEDIPRSAEWLDWLARARPVAGWRLAEQVAALAHEAGASGRVRCLAVIAPQTHGDVRRLAAAAGAWGCSVDWFVPGATGMLGVPGARVYPVPALSVLTELTAPAEGQVGPG